MIYFIKMTGKLCPKNRVLNALNQIFKIEYILVYKV